MAVIAHGGPERSSADTFSDIYVPKGNGGLVASAYHIKVTVRDHDSGWS